MRGPERRSPPAMGLVPGVAAVWTGRCSTRRPLACWRGPRGLDARPPHARGLVPRPPGGPPPPYPARVRPPSLAGPSAPGWEPDLGEARLRRDWEPRWTVALARDDVDAAWGALSAGVGSYLAERQGQAEGTLPPQARGARPKTRLAFAPAASRDGDARTRELAKAALRARQLSALASQWPEGPGCLPMRAEQVLRAARAGTAGCDGWRQRLEALTSRAAAVEAAALAAEELATQAAVARAGRRDRWHEWVGAELAQGGRRVFQWLRSPGAPPAPLFGAPGERVQGWARGGAPARRGALAAPLAAGGCACPGRGRLAARADGAPPAPRPG